jgi:predicted PurR-regulated permease PerM
MHTLNLIAVLLGILVAIALGVVLYLARSIVLPFLVALFLAYLLDPLVRFLTRLRVPLLLAVCLALLGTFVLLALMGTLFYASAQSFVKEYPAYEPKLRELVTTVTSRLEITPPDWQMADLGKKLASATVAKAVLSSLGSFITFLGRLLLVFLFTVFILLGQQSLPMRIRRAFGEEEAHRIIQLLERITRQTQTYLGAKALISLVTGILVNLVLILLEVDFAVLWGALAFMLNFIPHVGSPIAAIPPILVAVLKFDTLLPAVWVAVSLIAINVVLGGLIEPRLMGQRLNLSPLLVILSLFFWGWLWGIVGMVLAVPIMATIKIICENIPPLHFVSTLMSGK